MRFAVAVALFGFAQGATATPRLALFRLDALGLSSEVVEQLEGILRVELARAADTPLVPRNAIAEVIARQPRYSDCTGEPACLAPLAQTLGVLEVVAGNVGALGDRYVVNLKRVDQRGHELGRLTATLDGRADLLIQEVRVAAFRLVAPEKLTGSIALLSEVLGASVAVDGVLRGTTPLPAPISGLSVGHHTLQVARPGYSDYLDQVEVRFEKATEVVVHQRAVTTAAKLEIAERTAPKPIDPPAYSRWWFWTGASAVAIGLGVLIGGAVATPQTHATH